MKVNIPPTMYKNAASPFKGYFWIHYQWVIINTHNYDSDRMHGHVTLPADLFFDFFDFAKFTASVEAVPEIRPKKLKIKDRQTKARWPTNPERANSAIPWVYLLHSVLKSPAVPPWP